MVRVIAEIPIFVKANEYLCRESILEDAKDQTKVFFVRKVHKALNCMDGRMIGFEDCEKLTLFS